MILFSLVFAAILISFGLFTFVALKRTHKRWVTVTYSIMLFFSFAIFFGIAFLGPKVRDTTYTELDGQCRNTTSDVRKVDGLYSIANAQLCGVSCPCDAKPEKWDNYKRRDTGYTVLAAILPGESVVPTGVPKNGIVPADKGADNYP